MNENQWPNDWGTTANFGQLADADIVGQVMALKERLLAERAAVPEPPKRFVFTQAEYDALRRNHDFAAVVGDADKITGIPFEVVPDAQAKAARLIALTYGDRMAEWPAKPYEVPPLPGSTGFLTKPV